AVVDDLVAHVDRRPVLLQRPLDDLDGAVHTGAESARSGEQHLEWTARSGGGGHGPQVRPPGAGPPAALRPHSIAFTRSRLRPCRAHPPSGRVMSRPLLLAAAFAVAASAVSFDVADAQARRDQQQEKQREEAAKKRRQAQEWGDARAPLPQLRNAGPCPYVKVLYDAARYIEFE